MSRVLSSLLILSLPVIAAFSSSANYQLNSYGINGGGTNNTASTNYNLRGAAGEQTNGVTNSTNYSAGNGSIQTGELNVPPAPTLSNGSNTYYNRLLVTINNTVDPSDSKFAIAISSNSFSTTNYVGASGTLVSSPVYQSYSSWGGASGSFIVGLANSTTYEVKVAALENQFSNTNFGSYASATTVSPSITFSLTPNSISMGTLTLGSVVTSSNISFGITTNGNSGAGIYIYGAHSGLYSATQSYTIPAYSGNLASQSEGFGAQGTSPTQTSGGPLSVTSPFNGTGNNVGAESTTPQQIFSSSNPIVSGSANANLQAIFGVSTPTASDYSETLTFISAANF
jgi:hypothetical protein